MFGLTDADALHITSILLIAMGVMNVYAQLKIARLRRMLDKARDHMMMQTMLSSVAALSTPEEFDKLPEIPYQEGATIVTRRVGETTWIEDHPHLTPYPCSRCGEMCMCASESAQAVEKGATLLCTECYLEGLGKGTVPPGILAVLPKEDNNG